MRRMASVLARQNRGSRLVTAPVYLVASLLAFSPATAQTQDWTVAQDTSYPSDFRTVAQSRYGNPVEGQWTVRRSIPLDNPLALSRPDVFEQDVGVEWRRQWTAVHETTRSGLELAVEPHAGIDWDARGSTAVAGATVRFGQGLRDLAPDGDTRFGHTPRWYVFASGSRRAVGYNFTRERDGRLSNEGLSQDFGPSSMGDAAIGVAWRRGSVQSTVGLAYREVEIDGLRGYGGRKTDVDEGVLAFQISIRPQ